MYRILVVDQDEHLLWALEKNLFPERDDLEVITADTGAEGLEILKTGSIDLLVSDIKMPGEIDGFQLILRAKEIAADARVVIMTAFGAGRIESFADRVGITHYIEKPFNISELRDIILDLLDEREGFQGVLSDLELTDIIQMLCLAKRSTLLHLKHKDRRGKIVFEQGDVVHAEFGETVGKEAVYEMLDLKQGDIFMESDYDYDQQTIHIGWQDLLLEGVKLQDEARLREDSEGQEGNGGSPFASFRPEARIGSTTSDSALIDVGVDYGSEAEMEEESEVSDTDNAPPSLFSEEELEEISKAGEAAASDPSMFESEAHLSEAEDSDAHESPPSTQTQRDEVAPAAEGTEIAAEASQVEELAPSPESNHGRQAGSAWVNDSTKRSHAPATQESNSPGEADNPDGEGDAAAGLAAVDSEASGLGEESSSEVDENWSEQLEAVDRDDLAEAIDSESSVAEDSDAEDAEAAEQAGDESEEQADDEQDADADEMPDADVTAEGLGESVEAPESEPTFDDDEPVRSLSESSSYAAVTESRERRSPSTVAILEDFVADCPGLRVTGIFEDGESEPLSFIEASGAGTHDSTAIGEGFAQLVDRAQRTVSALDETESIVEVQIVLDDAYAVVRRLEGTSYFQLATVDRASSLGVILVMMRQYGARLSDALKQRS
jgi:DNA-binding response OmpR family regulator